tara:strand:+ start:34023 stop:36125 length:2103 start_codon:yes stop_codon:yes gene_type:complete
MKLISIYFVVTITFLNAIPVFGQVSTDSLKIELKNAPNDSVKFSVLVSLAYANEASNFSIANNYYDSAIVVATSNKWYKKVGNCYFNKAFYYHYSRRSDTAFEQVRLAQKWYEKAGNDLAVLNCLFTIGTFWMNVEQFDSSAFYLEKAIVYGNSINDTVYLHKIHNNLGLLYQYQGFSDKAIENFIIAVKIKEHIQSPDIGTTYINLGLSYNSANQTDQAIVYYSKALALFKENGNQKNEALCLNNIGEVYEDTNTDSSLFYYNQAYTIFQVLNDSNSMARSHNFFAKIYEGQQKYPEAIDEYEKAIEMIPSDGLKRLQINVLNNYTQLKLELTENNSPDLREIISLAKKAHSLAVESALLQGQSTSAYILFNAYTKANNPVKAVPYGQEYITINSSINSQARIDALAEQQTRFESEKKELEIAFLNKENLLKTSEIEKNNELQETQGLIIKILVGGVLLTLLFVGVISIYYRNQKKLNLVLATKNKVINKQKREKEVLLKEIHHRVKNNLQIIWSLLDLQAHSIKDEQVKLALKDGKNRVNSMAMIHTMLYQNNDSGNISFSEYLNKLIRQISSTYANSDNVEMKVDVPAHLKFNLDTSIPLGLLITELFTNAIKYGIKDLENPIIKVSLMEGENSEYTLVISDNGPGLPEEFDIRKTNSLGLKLVTNLSQQLQGNLSIANVPGAEFTVRFKGKSFTIA